MSDDVLRRISVVFEGVSGPFTSALKQVEAAALRSAKTLQGPAKMVDAISKKVATAGKSIKDAGSKLQAVGGKLGATIGTGILTANKLFADFDQAMTETFAKLGKQPPEIRAQMEELAKSLSMSGKVIFSPTELARGYEELASAGLDAVNSMATLETTAVFAQAGAFDLGTAVKSLTGAMASFGITTQTTSTAQFAAEMQHFSDVIVGVANATTTGVEEVARAMAADAAVAAKEFGLTVEETGAILGVYAMQTKEAEEAGNLTGRMLRLLSASAVNNKEVWSELTDGKGILDAAGNFTDIASAVEVLEGVLRGLSDEQKILRLQQLGFETLAQKSILPLIGQSKELRRQTALYKQSGTAQAMAAIQMESFWSQIKVAVNHLKVLGIELGSLLLPHVMSLINQVRQLTGWWRALSPETKQMIANTALFAAKMATLLVVIGGVVSFVGTALSVFGTFAGIVAWLAGSSTLLIPLLLAVAAGIAAILTSSLSFEDIQGYFSGALEWIKEFSIKGVGWLSNFKENSKLLLTFVKDNWSSILKDILTNVETFAKNMGWNMLVGLKIAYRGWLVFSGWLTDLLKKVFTVDFLLYVMDGLVAVGEKVREWGKGIKDAFLFITTGGAAGNLEGITGASLSLDQAINDLEATKKKMEESGVGNIEALGSSMLDVVKQEAGQFVNPFADMAMPSLQNLPEFNYTVDPRLQEMATGLGGLNLPTATTPAPTVTTATMSAPVTVQPAAGMAAASIGNQKETTEVVTALEALGRKLDTLIALTGTPDKKILLAPAGLTGR